MYFFNVPNLVSTFFSLVFVIIMAVAKKRGTIEEENRSFQNRWEDEYYVVQQRENCICLLCDLVITVMKKSNVCAHYSLKHKDMDARYPHGTESRSEKLMCLKNASNSNFYFWSCQKYQ